MINALLLLSVAAAPVSPASAQASVVTHQQINSFGKCIASKAQGAWSFVADDTDGGVFTNEGAPGVSNPYRVSFRVHSGGNLVHVSDHGMDNRAIEMVKTCSGGPSR